MIELIIVLFWIVGYFIIQMNNLNSKEGFFSKDGITWAKNLKDIGFAVFVIPIVVFFVFVG